MIARHFFLILLIFSSFVSFSQEEEKLKPLGGNWTAEVNFSPFSSNPININYIRLRKFEKPNSAGRLGISLSGNRATPDENITFSTLVLNFRPGFEKHLTGTKRLSPYIGGEVDIAFKNASFTDETDSSNEIGIDGAWDANGLERGYFRLGLNFIMGFDFYIAKKLYLGSEFGYGLELINTADIEFSGFNAPETMEGGSVLQFGPNFNSSVRLGFVF